MERKKSGFSKLLCLWVFRCDAMLYCWFAMGLIEEELVEEELVEEDREEMAEHHERER